MNTSRLMGLLLALLFGSMLTSQPARAATPNELIVTFDTGGDDLRGGNDNVHVILLRRGAPLRFENVNDRRRWADRSSHTIRRRLPSSIRVEEMVGIRVETTFGGGIGGDNWNLERVNVAARINGRTNQLLQLTGRPLFRFTGDQRSREFLFPPPTSRPPIIEPDPGTPPGKLYGWVDMHTHPMAHLAFGKKLIHGAPDVGSLIPAGTRGCNRTDARASSIADALGDCNSTHGGWGLHDNPCGDYVRAAVINLGFDKDFVHRSSNPHGDHHHAGYPDFPFWPHQTSVSHQQMWWEWIKRAHSGGLRVMVALAVNNELVGRLVNGDPPLDDKNSADLQLDEISSFVGRHGDFMEVARSAADLRRIVGANKLAVILGIEVDNIGNFHQPGVRADATTVKEEIRRLYHAKGVRYAFPIHLADNRFGGAAVYEDLFNYVNRYFTGELFTVTHSSDRNITFRLGSGVDDHGNIFVKAILDGLAGLPYPPAFHAVDCPIPTLRCWDKFQIVSGLMRPDPRYASYQSIRPGHVNAKGLTPLGEVAIQEMMRLGMIIDIDHMSERSAIGTLDLAEKVLRPSREKYPLNMGHNGIRGANGNERSAALRTVHRVRDTGGMFGVGTSDIQPTDFIRNFSQVWREMGKRGTAIGTDVNGAEPLPRASASLDPVKFYQGFPKCSTGSKVWDYTVEGVAHYGLMSDFLRDVSMQPGGDEVVKNLMTSAESFAVMWEKCERLSRDIR